MNTLETAQTHITRFTPQTGAPRAAVALRVSRQPRAAGAGETPAVRSCGPSQSSRVSESPRGDCRMQARGV